MNRYWLKITGAAVLTLAAIAGVYVFWPAETKPITKSKNTRHLQKEEKCVPSRGGIPSRQVTMFALN